MFYAIDKPVTLERSVLARFVLPLPPSMNHAYRHTVVAGRAVTYKTEDAKAWQRGVALIVGGWIPPERTPLRVTITLEVPRGDFHKRDIDGYLKLLLDSTIGTRADSWIDILLVSKRLGDGRATVEVEAKPKEFGKAVNGG